jgi:putative thioredoxin
VSEHVRTGTNVVEVTDATFQQAVIDESFRRPVVVDFWAAWCQPCRMIGPVLERLAEEKAGEFLLAKLDTDANPQASGYFRIQSIPAVKAFVNGALANEFVGAIPERAIRQFLDTVLPSEADRLAAEGEAAERAGNVDDAERRYRSAIELDSNNRAGLLGLARLAAGRGDLAEARGLVEPLRPDPEAERMLAALTVSEWAEPSRNGASGPLAQAELAAAEGRYQEALDVFIAAVRNGTDEDRRDAREAMLKVFAVLGEEDPLTVEYRRKLAAALF